VTTLYKDIGSTLTDPKLTLNVQKDGLVRAAHAVQFQVFSLIDLRVQVYPETEGEKEDAETVETGTYSAVWTATDATSGLYEIRWFLEMDEGDDVAVFFDQFDVLDSDFGFDPGYGLVSDLRDEGLTTTQANDRRCLRALERASADIDRYTGRRFLAERKSIRVNGNDGDVLSLGEPVIGLSGITVEGFTRVGSDVEWDVELDWLAVYNRHLRGVLNPDDRENPKIAFRRSEPSVSGDLFPRGTANVLLDGVFGYTDPSKGNPQGITPKPIRYCAMLLAMRSVFRVGSDDSEDVRNRHLITSERTADQSYSRAVPTNKKTVIGDLTGDPEIDSILEAYSRPFDIGAV